MGIVSKGIKSNKGNLMFNAEKKFGKRQHKTPTNKEWMSNNED